MRIVLAVDGSVYGEVATELLARIPWPEETECEVIQVLEGPGSSRNEGWLQGAEVPELGEAARSAAREQAVTAAKRMLGSGLAARAEVLEGGAPEDEILSFAESRGADLVVVGARGSGERRRFAVGRVTRRLIRDCPIPLLIVRATSEREQKEAPPLRILLALDASSAAHTALEEIERLPLGGRAEVTLLTVLTVGTTLFEKDLLERLSESWQAYKAKAEEQLERCRERLAKQCDRIETRLIDGGTDPADEILTAAEVLGADLLVAGHGAQSTVDRWLGGEYVERARRARELLGLVGRSSFALGRELRQKTPFVST